MKFLIPLLFLLAFLSEGLVRTENRPLKAMLYCYLPAVNTTDQLQEYGVLANTINAMLQKAKINVQVQVCDQNSNATDLYDENKINSYFDTYDIIEIDVVYLWAITQKLMTFKKEEIDYYDKVFDFEWEPLKNGNGELIGSPGLLCSNFHQTRVNGNYHDRLYSDYESKFALTGLYLSYFINNQQGRNLHNIDYSNAGSDAETIEQMANFLKECQDDASHFNFEVNRCLHWNWEEDSFFEEKYSRTIGYSENLFNFQNSGIEVKDIKISHIIGDEAKKKLFYMDSFIAKDGIDKKTVLDFYRFMLTDEVLDLYVNGRYTKDPKITYILPPTVEYFDKISKTDKIYEYLKQKIIEKSHVLPAYHQDYTKNIRNMKKVIRKSLETYSNTQATKRASHKRALPQL